MTEDYVRQLLRTLRDDPTPSPTPSDFLSSEGYARYTRSNPLTFQEVLYRLVKSRFLLDPRKKSKDKGRKGSENSVVRSTEVGLWFKVVEVRGIYIKPGKVKAYSCGIEFGKDSNFETQTVTMEGNGSEETI